MGRLDARVDEDGVLFVRIGKQAASQGRLELIDTDDCVQVRFKAEVYPATRDAVLGALLRGYGAAE